MNQNLMRKLIAQQLQAVVHPYVEYHGRDTHDQMQPTNPEMHYYTTDGVRRSEFYMHWDFMFAGQVRKFKAHVMNHECYSVSFELGDDAIHMVAAQEIVARFIAEVANKIEAWAVANNVPPENLLY